MLESAEAKRGLAERARDAWEAAQRRVSELRLARARGGEGSPTAADLAKARDAAELAEDRARLAAEDAEAYAAAVAAEAERAAIRAERARVLAIHEDTEAAARELHEAAERLGAALGAYVERMNHIAMSEPKLSNRFAEGAWHSAMAAIAGAIPLHIPLNVQRPTPFRDAERRARFPAELVALLAEKLPVPADPDHTISETEHAA